MQMPSGWKDRLIVGAGLAMLVAALAAIFTLRR